MNLESTFTEMTQEEQVMTEGGAILSVFNNPPKLNVKFVPPHPVVPYLTIYQKPGNTSYSKWYCMLAV